MEQALLAQACTALVLILMTPATMRRGLPGTVKFARLVENLRKSLVPSRRPQRRRGRAMRGARPWWE